MNATQLSAIAYAARYAQARGVALATLPHYLTDEAQRLAAHDCAVAALNANPQEQAIVEQQLAYLSELPLPTVNRFLPEALRQPALPEAQ